MKQLLMCIFEAGKGYEVFCTKLVYSTCFINAPLVECSPLNEYLVVPGVYNVAK